MLFDSLIVKLALIGILGIGAQWIAWRINRPAIALMLIAGIIAGPVTGLIDPQRDFGALQQPIIKLAVAVILFEGGLSLNFRELRHAGGAVLRLVLVGVPIGWGLGTMAAHYAAGLPLGISALFGGILVVTGPTVIGPMLRTLRVPNTVRDTLKWEGIVNDPIGALLAVAIFAYISYIGPDRDAVAIGFDVAAATLAAGGLGALLGFAMTSAFRRGYIPEYLKVPVVLVAVIAGFVAADLIKHETGLITVTIMGVVMANRPTQSTAALKHFKEDLAVLLISGVFIILSATLDWSVIERFQARFVIFLLLILFVVRPVTVLVSLMFSAMPWRERLFIAWIAPRGIVAIAVTGLFALRLEDFGMRDADTLVPLVFAVVITTIFAHGFSATWLARWLGIDKGKGDGVLLVGANSFTTALGVALRDLGLSVTVADTAKFALRAVRKKELEVHHGDILDEAMQDSIDMLQFQQVIAATDSDSYNALVCADLGPEMGTDKLTQTGLDEVRLSRGRGHVLFNDGPTIDELQTRVAAGWTFAKTKLSDVYGYEQYRERLSDGGTPLGVLKPGNRLLLFSVTSRPTAEAGDTILSFLPPEPPPVTAPKAADPAPQPA
ncbi:sodium:proton antiporter [Sphingomonas oligophenolica]|uniref:Sodium:proton antiporter n=1 Tax=Sphingomonas oligophenolica TaxID=301154 RepID=A0A502CAH8_9SPHN|nr:sodium:proton antiporter [Sphingomonas oligophenolica]TPG09948.1 sodium:proton antiporter [Sphingomonas oligophenolica]